MNPPEFNGFNTLRAWYKERTDNAIEGNPWITLKKESTMTEDEQIDQITHGISSPYGEGATYEGKQTEGSHLGKSDRKALIADIKALLDQARKETAKDIVGMLEGGTIMRTGGIFSTEGPVIIKHEQDLMDQFKESFKAAILDKYTKET